MTGMRILIAGGGIGGLTAAANLLMAGHDVTVFEQAHELTEVGAGIQLSANAMHVLDHIGLAQEIAKVAVRPQAYVFRLYDTGEEIQRFALAGDHERMHGAPYFQLHRGDLHDLLAKRVRELDPGAIRLDHRVVGFGDADGKVDLRFADGTRTQGDLLIGADGIKSVIRERIVGNVPTTYTGDAGWRLTIPSEHLPTGFMEPVMSVWMGPGSHVVAYYIRAGALLNFVGIVETDDVREESWTTKLPWTRLKKDFEGWHADVQTIIDAVDRQECYRWSFFSRPTIKNWSRGSATLLGDAAHPTLPYLAQGAAMAIEDGAVLTRALQASSSVPAALALYQRNRVDRTARIVHESSLNRARFHLRSRAEIRNEFTNRNEGSDRNAWLYSYNPLAVPLK